MRIRTQCPPFLLSSYSGNAVSIGCLRRCCYFLLSVWFCLCSCAHISMLFIMFCHILYISKHINLIIKEEAHLSLTVDNKIVTKKNEEIRLVVGFLCKGNKRQLPAKKETRLLPYNSFFKSSMSGRALRSRSGISLEARYVATPIGLL